MELGEEARDAIARLLWLAAGYPDPLTGESAPLDKQKKQHLYAMIDASREPMMIPPTIQGKTDSFQCLYRGKALEEFGDDTAWAAELLPSESVLDWLLAEGFGKRWAIFAVSELGLEAFVGHMRKFTLIEDDEGKRHFFRFYDPQALRQYLPVFTTEQRNLFFRGATAFFLENTQAPDQLLVFTLNGEELARNVIELPKAKPETEPSQPQFDGSLQWS